MTLASRMMENRSSTSVDRWSGHPHSLASTIHQLADEVADALDELADEVADALDEVARGHAAMRAVAFGVIAHTASGRLEDALAGLKDDLVPRLESNATESLGRLERVLGDLDRLDLDLATGLWSA